MNKYILKYNAVNKLTSTETPTHNRKYSQAMKEHCSYKVILREMLQVLCFAYSSCL